MAPLRSTTLRRSAAAGAGALAAASLRALARPLPKAAPRGLLDWEAVRATAHARTGERGSLGVAEAARLGAGYDALAAELAPLMSEVCQAPLSGYPGFAALDRRGFVDANLLIVERLLEPVERLRTRLPDSRLAGMSRALLSRYLGELLGFLSRRVLGQYDPVLLLTPPPGDHPAPSLFLVEPNVEAFARRHQAPAAGLRRWLVLHELTHAWQFEAHPWLRVYLADNLRELLQSELLEEAAGDAAALRRLGSPLTLLRGAVPTVRGQLRAAARLQAVMSVAEGYGNFVMHRVGERHIEDFGRLERAFHERSTQRPLLEQLVLAVTGMRLKLRQYELGEHFAEAVTQRGGLSLLNRVWEGPEMMPSLAELRQPERWLGRAGASV